MPCSCLQDSAQKPENPPRLEGQNTVWHDGVAVPAFPANFRKRCDGGKVRTGRVSLVLGGRWAQGSPLNSSLCSIKMKLGALGDHAPSDRSMASVWKSSFSASPLHRLPLHSCHRGRLKLSKASHLFSLKLLKASQILESVQ